MATNSHVTRLASVAGKGGRADSILLARYCHDWQPYAWEPRSKWELRLREISRAKALLKKPAGGTLKSYSDA